jgi:hypothetical protein
LGNKTIEEKVVETLNGCQLPCVPNISNGKADFESQSAEKRLKRALARPWNNYLKKFMKRLSAFTTGSSTKSKNKVQSTAETNIPVMHFQVGDMVRVRSMEDIQATLGSFNELKGCAFLDGMEQYCGTQQRIFKVMERFLDERDYKVKKTRGIMLLEEVYCQGTPVFGRCDRSCLLFWREEWLEKVVDQVAQ